MAFALRFAVGAGMVAGAVCITRTSKAQENLHVAVACANNSVMTAEGGLHVSLDGAPLQGRTEIWTALVETRHGGLVEQSYVSDVAFTAPPGAYQLHIDSDDCAGIDRPITIGRMPTSVEGRLEVANPILRGPSGAPDGIEFALGAFTSSQPSAIRNGTVAQGSQTTTFTTTEASMQGFTFSGGIVGRYATVLSQQSFGFGKQTRISGDGSNARPFTDHIIYSDTSLRIGARLPLHDFALSAGSGIALSLWSPETPSDSPQLTIDFPVWGSLDVKPFCDWGLRFTGSVNLDPFVKDETSVMAGAMMFYQPSASCSEEAGVTIRS